MTDALPNRPSPTPHHDSTQESRGWACGAHLAALSTYVGLGVGGVLGPLIVWLIKKDSMPIVDDQGKEALNFNISVLIYGIVCIPLVFVIIGVPLLIALSVFHVVFTIIAAVKSYEGAYYRYPLTIRLIN